MDFDEYETLPTNNFLIHMIAGAIAGVMEHCVMYPLDSVKTRMQSLSPNVNYTGISDALKVVVRQEGIFRLVRGMNAVVAGAGPAHALYFSCYEQLKEILQARTAKPFYMVAGVSGGVATILHDAVMTPTEVVKQRLQMYNSPYKSIVDCAKRTYHAEGMRAFYRSYTTQLTMNIPFQSIHFMTYEFCQSLMNEEKSYNPGVHMASGAVAGAVAAAITTPLDVVKTLLNTQQHSVKGMRAAFKTVYRISGFAGYFKGIQARIIYQMPSTAICWSVYELFKYLLSNKVKEVRCSDKPLTPKILMSDDEISPKLCPGLLFVESSVERGDDGYTSEIETKNNWEDKIEVEEEAAGERSPIEVIGRTFADERKWSNGVSSGMQIFDSTLLGEQFQ